MNSHLFLFCLSILFISCASDSKTSKKLQANGDYLVGTVRDDSVYNGIVKVYDKNNRYLGYRNYKYGLEDGVSVHYYRNGASDSSFFSKGLKNGYAYKFDALHRLRHKNYYYNDRPLGHNYEYDSLGKLNGYYFTDFEGNVIYETKLIDSIPYEKGNLIEAVVNRKLIGTEEKEVLFLYLIDPPFVKTHYEIAILNEQKQIISSKRINAKNCFYEQELQNLPEGHSLAIVLHQFNSQKGKDDLKISVIE